MRTSGVALGNTFSGGFFGGGSNYLHDDEFYKLAEKKGGISFSQGSHAGNLFTHNFPANKPFSTWRAAASGLGRGVEGLVLGGQAAGQIVGKAGGFLGSMAQSSMAAKFSGKAALLGLGIGAVATGYAALTGIREGSRLNNAVRRMESQASKAQPYRGSIAQVQQMMSFSRSGVRTRGGSMNTMGLTNSLNNLRRG